ncbi:MAG: CDP-2,3-bis-(O-geranylgeranyl)-sn-glycerol synthase [Candidatus Heimdallarchaeota archaeon]|nr:CDP-2,3-bis-(O-geranylgeranyl)-sn-glycerol synthase [Candidatus Heimdallarchaeota archaeon]
MLTSWFETIFDSEVFNAIFFVLPCLVANVTPLLFGGGLPMDFRKNWFDGRRILGNNKTIRGFAAGFITGFLVGLLTRYFLINNVGISYTIPITNGFLQGLGAVLGDVVGSFIKRRMNIPSGGSLIVMDQIGFMIFGMALARIDTVFPWTYWIIMLPLAGCVHFAANAVGYTMGWKDVWW